MKGLRGKAGGERENRRSERKRKIRERERREGTEEVRKTSGRRERG